MARRRQLSLLKNQKSAYGGELLKTRSGRSQARPLATRETMHLVLRSSAATGDWSFKRAKNEKNIARIVQKFGFAYGVRIISMANVGNHLHLQIKLANRFTYAPFIRAITGAIAQAVTGRTRWSKDIQRGSNVGGAPSNDKPKSFSRKSGSKSLASRTKKFWDYRPFTRIVQSFRAYLNLKDYVRINQLEGNGAEREEARFMLSVERVLESEPDKFYFK